MIDYTFYSEKSFKNWLDKLFNIKPKGFERTEINELLKRWDQVVGNEGKVRSLLLLEYDKITRSV